MTLFNIASKAAALMATGASLYDVNQQGVRQANIKRTKNYADDFIANEIGSSKLNYASEKHGGLKKWMQNFKYPYQFSELCNTVTGYVQGAIKGIGYNLPTLISAGFAFFGKKSLQKIGFFGMGLSVVWDFVKNSTNLFEKTDYLRK